MAAIVEMSECSELSSSSDDTDSVSEEDSSSSDEEERKATSWGKMYRSMKSYVASNEENDLSVRFIFHIANEATMECDFLDAIKLYSFGLLQFYKECQPSHPRYTGSTEEDGSSKRIPLDKTMLRYAIQGCSLDKEKLASNKSKVARILDCILQYCDFLSLMDFTLLKSIAYLYFNLTEKQKAFHLSARALQMNPKSLSFQEMFENICCHLVERWHFIMLNDKARNSAYQKAIESVLRKIGRKATVCDIGCGTGLLSLIACLQPNTDNVFAIEMSTSMCEVASSVFSANLDPVTMKKMWLINKMSTKIFVPAHIASNSVDLLVTETFDAGLFGEGILPTLIHAWSKLLKNGDKERGQVIPGKAQLYLQAIECDAVLKESRFLGQFDGLNTSKIHIYGSAGLSDANPYAVHDLSSLPGGYRTLSEPVRFLDVNFNNPQELYCLSKGNIQKTLVEITSSGRLDAIVVWFSLHLDDSVVISTHTDCNSCWEQAIIPVHPVKVLIQPLSCGPVIDLNLQAGVQLKVRHEVVEAKLCLEVVSIFRPGEASRRCNNHIPRFLHDQTVWWNFSVYCLDGREVSILNNASLHNALYKRLQELSAQFENSQVDFIHLNDAFSPLCLQALKLGFQQATVLIHDRYEKALLQKMMTLNDIDKKRLKLVEDISEVKSLMLPKKEKKSQISSGPDAGKSAVFIYDLVDPHGRLIDGLKFQQKAIRYHLSKYKRVGIAPYSIDVYGVLIDSERLQCLSRVQSDGNTLGFNIGSFINKYSTRNHQDFSLRALPHTKLSEPFKMFTINTCRLFKLPETRCMAAEQSVPTKQADESVMKRTHGDTAASEQQVHEPNASLSHPLPGHKRKFSELTPVTEYGPDSTSFLPKEELHIGMEHILSSKFGNSAQESSSHPTSAGCETNKVHYTQNLFPNKNEKTSVVSLQESVAIGIANGGLGLGSVGDVEVGTTGLNVKENNYPRKSTLQCAEKQGIKASSNCSVKDRIDGNKEGSRETRYRTMKSDDDYDAFPDYDDYLELAELTKSVLVEVPVIQPGSVTALVYWFDLHISSTCSISTLDPAHHWNQSAVMSLPSQNKHVAPGHALTLSCEMSGSAISFSIE